MKKSRAFRLCFALALLIGWMLACCPAAGESLLTVELRGLSLVEGGNWRTVALNAVFDVTNAQGEPLGTLAANATQAQLAQGLAASLAIPAGAEQVVLRPREETLPQGYRFEASYATPLGKGQAGVTVLVYKAEGLFTLQNTFADGAAAPGGTFCLEDSQGQTVLAFTADDAGSYEAQAPVPAGKYTLRQTALPQGALPGEAQALSIPVYTGQPSQITQVSYVNGKAPTDQETLGSPALIQLQGGGSLYEGEQTFSFTLQDGVAGGNTWPLNQYRLILEGLTLVDGRGKAIQEQTEVYLSRLNYQGGDDTYSLSVEMLDAKGAKLGEPMLLSAGETLVNTEKQARGMVITYIHRASGQAVAQPEFKGGELTLTIACGQRQPQPNAPAAAGLRLTARSRYQLVYPGLAGDTVLEGKSAATEVHLPVDEGFELAAALTVDSQGQGEAVLRNVGNRTLTGTSVTLALPQGWRLEAVGEGAKGIRMAQGDYLALQMSQPLAPGAEKRVSLTLAAFTQEGEAAYYVKNVMGTQPVQDNPQGLVFPNQTLVTDPALNLAGCAQFGFIAQAQGEQKAAAVAGSLEGCLYEDKNGNGKRDRGESGQGGLQVEKQEGSLILRAFTQADGSFTLPGILGEGERLSFLLPENMLAGEANQRLEIPYTVSCAIGGRITAGKTPVAGVTVRAQLSGGASALNATTDSEGCYQFSQLAPGTYAIAFELEGELAQAYAFADGSLEQWQAGSVTVGEGGKEAQANGQLIPLGTATLEASGLEGVEAVLTQDGVEVARGAFNQGRVTFIQLYPGDYQMTLPLPEGMMLSALNGDAAQSKEMAQWKLGITGGQESLYRLTLSPLGRLAGEILWEHPVEITLTAQCQQELAVTVTQGAFAFDSLIPGLYTLSADLPEGYVLAAESSWQALGGHLTLAVEVTAGETAQAAQLELFKAAQVSGQVFADANANGRMDDEEMASAGIPVALYRKAGEAAFERLDTQQTDAQGTYAFENLLPGAYYLTMEAPQEAAFNQIGGSVIAKDGQSAPFDLADGQRLTANGTLVIPTGLRAVVFIDANENGERGVYERMVEGAKITVLDGAGAVVAQGETNAAGEALFEELLPGSYRLCFQIPSGYGFSVKGEQENKLSSVTDKQEGDEAYSETVTLVQGKVQEVASGVVRLGVISGKAWYDSDANGIMGSEEPGQAGVKVTLTPKKASGTTYELETAADGAFTCQVRPGSYILSITAPEGLMFTRYSQTGREKRSIFTAEGRRTGEKTLAVEAGKAEENVNVGFVTGGVIEGLAFLDADYDGLYQPGDGALAQVKVELVKAATGETIATAVTGDDGRFTFDALRGANYRLRAVLPDETVVFSQTVAAGAQGNWFEAKAGRRDSTLNTLTLADMERKTLWLGAVRTGTLTGQIYFDDNYSGAQDGQETTVSGLTVTLADEEGAALERVRTNAQGIYTFEGLVPGSYQVRLTAKTGYVFTRTGEGSRFTSISDEGEGVSDPIDLAMGETLTGIDGGMIRPGRISGQIFSDANDNGLQEAGEGGLAGVTVTLMNAGDGSQAFQLVTEASGAYSFNRVMPGSYYVHYTLPEGAAFAKPVSGGSALRGEGLQAASDIFDFKTAEIREMPLGGGVMLAALAGVVYEDLNGSGALDAGEPFLAGARVTLGGQEVVTGADGSFILEGLRPASYTLEIACPEGGYVFTRGGEAFAPRGQAGATVIYEAAAGQQDRERAVGMVRPGSVTGHVWMDEDLSAAWEENESTLAGMEVTLRDLTDGETAYTVTTDGEGCFVFENLIPGSYEAVVDMPASCIAVGQGQATFRDNGQGQLVQPAFTLAAGEAKAGLLAGVVQYTTLEGMTWQDQGGQQLPLEGVTVALVRENGSVATSAVTGADGLYAFTQVLPGSYTLAAQLPQGYLLVNHQDERVTSGRMMSVIEAETGAQGASAPFQVVMAANEAGLDIGAVKPGMLGDKAWLDENGNGLQDTGEAAMPGITVTLLKDGEAVKEAVTDIYGYYLFSDVYPSTYDVQVTWHEELTPTRKREDFAQLNSKLQESQEATQLIEGVEIQSDVKNFAFDFGFALRKPGVYPAAMQPAPTQVWR